MAEAYTIQREIKIYDDATGDYISVAMDGDALDLVEIRQVEGEKGKSLILTRQQSLLLASALQEYNRIQPEL